MQKQNNSTTFKTLNGDLTVFNKTLISTKDNLRALETVNTTVYNKNGAFNLQGLLVNSSQSVSTFTRLNNAFKAYNGNLSKSTQLQNAYIQAIGNQNISLGNYLAGLNGAKASMWGYIKSLVGAKAATIGLQVVSTALNAAISMGLSLAISALVSAITSWINKEKEARETAIETAQAAKEKSNNLSDLLNQYNQLSKEVKINSSVKEDLLSVQSDLLEALGIEASQIGTLIEKYGDLDTAINQITLDSLRKVQADLMGAVDAYEEELLDVGADGFWGGNNIISATGDSSVKAFKALEKAGVVDSGSYGSGGGAFVLVGDDTTVEGILQNYQKLKDAQEALNNTVDNGSFTMDEMTGNPLYKAINARLKEIETAVDSYNTSVDDLNKNIAQQQILSSMTEMDSIPETKEEFESFKQSMIDAAIASTKFIGNQDDIRDSIINVLSTMPEFEKYFEDISDKSETLNNETAFSFSYDKLSEIPQKLSEVENAYKTAQEALESYNEKGYYTMDIIDSILSLEDEYINILVDENGQLQINSDSMNHLAAIKIEAAKASIYQETCEELVRIKTLDTSLAAQELALVNGTLTESAYETARALYKEVIAMGGANALLAGNVWNAATKKVKVLDNQLKALNQGTYNVGKLTISDSATKAVEDATEKTKDYIEAYMKFQKQSLESSRIAYNTYCNSVSNMLKSMYKDGKISAQDYHDYVGQMLETRLDVYKKVLSAVTKRFDKEIDSINNVIDGIEKQNDALEKQKSLMESAIDAVISYYDSLIDAEQQSIDNLEAKNDSIQEQIDKYDSLIYVADKVYDDEQKSLEEQQSLLQDKIDALNDENDALDLQYRKEQALIALRRAQTQRTKKVYNGIEFVYDTDKEAIREAQKNLQDIKTEELISDLEKEKNALQEAIDELQKYRDALGEISDTYEQLIDEQNTIDLLGNDYKTKILGVDILDWEKLKDRYVSANKEMADNTVLIDGLNQKIDIWDKEKEQWSSLTQSIKDNVSKQAAIQQFGADWEQQINEGRFVIYDDFKNRYLSIENQINDNTQLIESYNQKIEYYENLKSQWANIADIYEQSVEDQYVAMILGQQWESDILSGRIDTLNSFRNNYVSIQQAIADAAWNSANAQIKAAQEAAKAANGIPQTAPVVDDGEPKKTGNSSGKTTPPKLVNNKVGNYMTMYGSGTDSARKGVHLVSEHDGDEMIIRNNKSAVVANGAQLYPFEGGEVVIKASETEKILKNTGNLVPLDSITFGKGENAIHFTQEEFMQRLQSIMPSYSSMVQIPNFQMPKSDFVTTHNETTPVVQNINLTLPNVTNNSGYERINRELKQMQIDAYQFARRK